MALVFLALACKKKKVCSEPVIDFVDILLESFKLMPAVDRFIQGGVINI